MEYWKITYDETPERRVIISMPDGTTQAEAEAKANQIAGETEGEVLTVEQIELPET